MNHLENCLTQDRKRLTLVHSLSEVPESYLTFNKHLGISITHQVVGHCGE